MYRESDYWDRRYRSGKNSGVGSYGDEADFKRGIIDAEIKALSQPSILDLGCGDMNLLGPMLRTDVYSKYLGVDVSKYMVDTNIRSRISDRCSFIVDDISKVNNPSDVVIMMDVMFHMSSDDAHESALQSFFRNINKVGIISYWNALAIDMTTAPHCFYRETVFPAEFEVITHPVPNVDIKSVSVVRRI